MLSAFPLSILFLASGISCLHAFECNVLGVEITEPEGILESPPSTASNKNCIWLLQVPEGKYLKLNFTKFGLRRQQLCVNSFVEFTSVEYFEVRYCGGERPPLLTFAGPQEIMFYTRIGTTPVPGFRAEFWTEDSYGACPWSSMLCRNGNCYSKSQRCNFVDDCGDGSDEEGCGHSRVEPLNCGRPAITPLAGNDYIAGGRDALPGSWPWQVSLQMRDVFPSGHFCGATLIDNLWILTAAHCFETRNESMVRARFGSYDTFVYEDGSLIRNVEKVISHPDYDPDTIENDIALLKMASPVPFSSTVSPACLPEEMESLEVGSMMYATGWGDGKYYEKIEVLRQAVLPLIDFDRCNQMYFGEVNKNTLCTHYNEGGHSTCMGDSGGPLVFEKGTVWKVYGVVSWGHEDCGHKYWPSVYTNVASFIPWIRSVIKSP